MTRGVLARRVLSMASGTLASRATGLVRVLVLAWVLGFSPLADSYNLANTVPNMLYDLVLGGVASATFIPVFVEYLSRDGERRAWRSISSVVTLALSVLAIATLVTWLVAPAIIDGFTMLHHGSRVDAVALHAQRSVAVSLLRWFAPQIFFYGLLSLGGALLNARHRFGASAWVPVANNLICVAVLVWFHLSSPHPRGAGLNGHELLVLGLGTTLGVVVQFICLVPSLLRADLWRLSLRPSVSDPAVKKVLRLGSWTIANVVANQCSLAVVLAMAFGLGGSGSVSAYTYGWSFMQMPYAVVVVSVLNALTPAMAANAAAGRLRDVERDARTSVTNSLLVIVPATVLLVVLAQPLVALLLGRGHAETHLAAGVALAVLAAGLPGFTVFAVVIRTLQALQHGRDTFFLYAVQNGLTIVLVLAWGRHTLGGVVAAVSVAYTLAAILGVVSLSTRGVSLGYAVANRALGRVSVASIVAGLAAVVSFNLASWPGGVLLALRTAGAFVVAVGVFFFLTRPLWKESLRRARNRDKVETD